MSHLLISMIRILAEIEVLNKEIERFETKISSTTISLSNSTPMTGATIPRHVDSGIAVQLQILALGVKMTHTIRLHPKPVTNSLELWLCQEHVLIKLIRRNPRDNKYMGFDNGKVSPVRRHIPDFAVDSDYISLKDKRSISPNQMLKLLMNTITHENGCIGTKSKSIIKSSTYDSNGPWLDYNLISILVLRLMIGQIEKKVGTWLYLFGDRQTQGVLGNLPLNARQDFEERFHGFLHLIKQSCIEHVYENAIKRQLKVCQN